MTVLPLWRSGAQSWGVRRLGSLSVSTLLPYYLRTGKDFPSKSGPLCSDQSRPLGRRVPSSRQTQEANSLHRNCTGDLCAGDSWGRSRSMGVTPTLTSTSTTWTSFSPLTFSGERTCLNRLTYIFKESSCLQHYFFEAEAHISVCEQLQDLSESLQASQLTSVHARW